MTHKVKNNVKLMVIANSKKDDSIYTFQTFFVLYSENCCHGKASNINSRFVFVCIDKASEIIRMWQRHIALYNSTKKHAWTKTPQSEILISFSEINITDMLMYNLLRNMSRLNSRIWHLITTCTKIRKIYQKSIAMGLKAESI